MDPRDTGKQTAACDTIMFVLPTAKVGSYSDQHPQRKVEKDECKCERGVTFDNHSHNTGDVRPHR